MRYVVQIWCEELQPDGTTKSWAENTPYPDKGSALAAYKRLLERLADPDYQGPAGKWGVSAPDLEAEEQLAPASERAKWLKEMREVRLGHR